MAITRLQSFNISPTANFTFANITATNANLGNQATANYFIGNFYGTANLATYATTANSVAVANVTGIGNIATTNYSGNGSQVLAGNGVWITQASGSGISNGNSNVNIPTSDGNINLSTSGNANVVVVTGTGVNVAGTGNFTGNLTAGNFIAGTGSGGNISSANVISANTFIASGNITASNANLGNSVIANFFIGSGINLTSIAGGNVSGQVANALVAGTVYTNAQPNITSVGTLTGVTSTGTINFTGASNVALGPVANVKITGGSSGQYLQTDGTGTLSWSTVSSSTPSNIGNGNSNVNIPSSNGNINISAVGNANIVVVTGTGVNVAGTGNFTGNLTAGNFIAGTGSGGNISNANVISANTFIASGNITATNANLGNSVIANYFIGSLYGTANLATYATTANSVAGANVSGQVGNSLVAGTVYTNAQPNITSVGTLTNLNVSGNLVVGGNTTYVNVETFTVEDPIIELGSGVNAAPLTTNDAKDRGTLLHYYTSAPVDAFMGWDNSNAEFAFGSNVSVTSEVVTFNSLGNVRASYFIGNGSQLIGVVATTGNANYANYAGNAFSITGSNVSGQVGNALVSGTVYTNAQPNITSVGDLTGLTSNGVINFTNTSNVSLGSVGNIKISGGSANYVLKTDGAGNLSWTVQSGGGTGGSNISNGSSTVNIATGDGNINLTSAGNTTMVVTNTGANIIGTLNATGNVTLSGPSVSLGSVTGVRITGGSNAYVLSTDGTGNLNWVPQPSSANVTVDNFTGNGVQTVFTLSTTPADKNQTSVNYNGATVLRTAYSLANANITFSSPPANSSSIEVTTINLSSVNANTTTSGGFTCIEVTANTTATANTSYIIDTSTSNITLTLPSNPSIGARVEIIDGVGNASIHGITIGRNGGKIQGSASDMTVTTNRSAFTLVYYNAAQGWILTSI